MSAGDDGSRAAPARGRQFALFAIKAAVSAGLIAYLLSQVSASEAWAGTKGLSASTVVLALALLTFYIALGGVRWLLVLRALGGAIRTRDALGISFAAMFFNQFLPATVAADAARAWVSSRHGLALRTAVSSVFLERFLQLFALSVISAAGASAWSDGRLPAAMTAALWLVALLGMAAAVFLVAFNALAVGKSPALLQRTAGQLSADAGILLMQPKVLFESFLTVLIGQAMLALAIFVLAQRFDSPLGFVDYMALTPAIILVSSLPISVAGWGVREYTMVTVLGYGGLSSGNALALSVLVGVLSALASLPGCFSWLALERRR